MDAQPEKEHIRHTGTNFEETVQSTRDKANWKCYVTSVINLSPSPGGGGVTQQKAGKQAT